MRRVALALNRARTAHVTFCSQVPHPSTKGATKGQSLSAEAQRQSRVQTQRSHRTRTTLRITGQIPAAAMAENFQLQSRHGKSRVRVSRVWRRPAVAGGDVIVEWNVAVSIVSDCLPSYTSSDNSAIVATDSIKNTVRSSVPRVFLCFLLPPPPQSGSGSFWATDLVRLRLCRCMSRRKSARKWCPWRNSP
jgi:hypothetical protein